MVIHSQKTSSLDFCRRKWLKGGGHLELSCQDAVSLTALVTSSAPGTKTQTVKNALQNLSLEACSSVCRDTKRHDGHAISKSV